MRTFLQLVQAACDELGIPQLTQIVGAQDDQSRQLLALSNREGREFSGAANRYGGWQALHKEYIFQTVSLPETTGDTVEGSPVISNIPSTAGIVANTWTVVMDSVPYQAKVISVDSGTQVTIDQNATSTVTGASISFGQNAYDLPSDLNYFMDKTGWDGNFRWQLLGALDAQEKNVLKYGISPVGPRRSFWILGNKMIINPTPTESGNVIAYDYLSNNWCLSPAGAGQNLWTTDDDTYALDEDCFILGLKYRWKRAKGLDYGEEFREYVDECNRVLSRDGWGRDLPTNAQATGLNLLSDANIPDTGFGM